MRQTCNVNSFLFVKRFSHKGGIDRKREDKAFYLTMLSANDCTQLYLLRITVVTQECVVTGVLIRIVYCQQEFWNTFYLHFLGLE